MGRYPRHLNHPAAILLAGLLCLSARSAAAPPAAGGPDPDTLLAAPSYGADRAGELDRPAARTSSRPKARQIAEPAARLVFATIADSHIRKAAYADTRYIKAMNICGDLLQTYVGDISAHVPPVDFAVHLGDLTDLGRTEEFEIARQIMDGLACPFYAVVGNHDNFGSDAKALWRAFAHLDSTVYSFDARGFHFIVIDCTLNPYGPPYVDCDSSLRTWVAENLAANSSKPTVVLSHYNMWQRHWNAMFDTTLHYTEYRGMPELRRVLEDAGNVVAVVNGHVHANRVERHNGISYVDVGATLVGPPSVRYFYFYSDHIRVDYEYISNRDLADSVTSLCGRCCCCFSEEEVCGFADGTHADKCFTIPISPALAPGAPGPEPLASSAPVTVKVDFGGADGPRATIRSDLTGAVDVSLHDVLGRGLDRCSLWKSEAVLEMDLAERFERFHRLPAGIYFLRLTLGGEARTEKVVLLE